MLSTIKTIISVALLHMLCSSPGQTAINSGQTQFLSPDDAFRINLNYIDDRNIQIIWDIEKDYYLYVGMFDFKLDGNTNKIREISLPVGQKKVDEFFGEVDIYKTKVVVDLSFESPLNLTKLIVKYQGCAEAGLCYPPIQKIFELKSHNSKVDGFVSVNMNNDQIGISKQLFDKPLIYNIFLFLLAGLLLSFTPCVFPMIPILTGLIVGQGTGITPRKSFLLSFTYVFFMAITYSLIGILVALSGANIQASLQNPYVITFFALLFVFLALAMMGFMKIEIPRSIQNFIISKSNNNSSGSYIGVAIMGALSALIVGPCVTAPLIGALIYIATSGDPFVGGIALFSLGIGMGIPLLILGTSATAVIKRIGKYLPIVNIIFGFLFLIVAVWLIERIISIELSAILWALVALTLLLQFIYSSDLKILNNYFRFSVIAIFSSYIALQSLGIYQNNNYNPMFSFVEQKNILEFKIIYERDDLIKEINSSGKLTMVDLYADWCIACKELEKYTFTDKRVSEILKQINLVKYDITESTEGSGKFLSDYSLFGPPVILFFDDDGRELKDARVVGFVDSDTFLKKLNKIHHSRKN
tara:strand:- start:29454 stop:31208 length:1755 start_codon:yes stop_codon:yes gene_type:complete